MWNELKSQPVVARLLQKAIANERVHHGYLLIGEDSETVSVAMALAKALNCEKVGGDFCNGCASCVAIEKGNHPDIYIVKPESRSRRITIHQVRELEKSVYLKATLARIKVGLIYFADRLMPEAQDAFLKTFEEPPKNTVFILMSEEFQQLKETMLSRCLRLPLRPSKGNKATEAQLKVREWLASFSDPKKGESTLVMAYGLAGKILDLLKKSKDEKLEEARLVLDDPSIDHMDKVQKDRIEEQVEAQAQADYLRERSLILKTMVEWFHEEKNDPQAVEVIEDLSRKLGRNVNEPLACEVAMLELAGGRGEVRNQK